MAERTERTVLNHLIDTCRDGERGFRLAAERVTDPGLRTLFTELASQRARFATELLPHAQRLGGDGAAEGTIAAALHRGWMAFEDAVRRDDHVLVSEAERGNRATLAVYADALNSVLAPRSRDLVQRQLDEIEESHARIPVREMLSERRP